MARRRFHFGLAATFACGLLSATSVHADALAPDKPVPDQIDYNRDVRPILSDNCFHCHGFDKNHREADLRLDTKDGLLSVNENDVPIVKPGKPDESELFKRLVTDDPDERMPDPKSNKRLSARDIAVIRKWIEQGATWQGHWAFIKPARPDVPRSSDDPTPGFVRNDVDRFVLARLKENALTPSPEADKATLLRRVTFDLTGLPPTRAEVEAFTRDPSPDAYDKVVDRLLASPAYGERMAMYWLDLVRYADTIGYHSDNPMNVSPYRDWVVRAFNENKPFDRFTNEQIAGDLLPDAGVDQKVASAYNRLLQTTEEGGAQAKEYVQKYLADRVRNVSTVWLGVTLACSQCHDHKFDPLSTKDFYAFGAFFADVQEGATGRREAGMPVPDPQQAADVKRLDEAIAAAKRELETVTVPGLADAQTKWERTGAADLTWRTLEPASFTVTGTSKLRREADGVLRNYDKAADKESFTVVAKTDAKGVTGIRLEALDDDGLPHRGPGTAPNGNFVLTEFKLSAEGERKPLKFKAASAEFSQGSFPVKDAIDGKANTGWAVLGGVGKPQAAVFELAEPLPAKANGETSLKFTLDFQSPHPQHNLGKFRLSLTTAPSPANRVVPAGVTAALALAPDKRTDAQRKEIAAYYRTIAPALQPARDRVAALEAEKTELLKNVPTCLVSTSGKPRVVRVLPRGNWLDETGEVVEPAVPHVLPPLAVKDRRPTRLDLAQWLTSADNPLTARVFVNRAWKLFFGTGLSKVLDDLGMQGEWPTHPELLDWLAVDFQSNGWDVKRTVRQLVTSGAYRQSSKPRATDKERDPYNRLYARQSRFRLDAETVRDNALSVSGLLVNRLGGKSVFPYQPAGYWFALNFPTREWKNDKGDGLYRRGLYTHWQRSFLHPSLLAFDAPSREEGTCERARSNIPQQALVLLNDPTYVEAARVFAGRMIKEGGAAPADRIRWAYETALSRAPRDEETKLLTDVLAKHAREYAEDAASAQKLLAVGDAPPPAGVEPAELAAWTSVARVILNLSETITRY